MVKNIFFFMAFLLSGCTTTTAQEYGPAPAGALGPVIPPAAPPDQRIEIGSEQEQEEQKSWFQIHNPWADTGDRAPEPEPYQLPQFESETSHWTQTAPLQTAPYVDAERLFYAVIACYPEKSKFGLEVDLEARFSDRSGYIVSNSEIAQHYVGVVASMPLYSASELSRERDREHNRRLGTTEVIGNFMQALAGRNHAHRELGLYSSLEARAQVRVAQGVTDTAEQVGYLEKVATAQRDLIRRESELLQHRLALISHCAKGKADTLNSYIKGLTELPKASPP